MVPIPATVRRRARVAFANRTPAPPTAGCVTGRIERGRPTGGADPVATWRYVQLQRSLTYSGVTQSESLILVTGQRKALAMAVSHSSGRRRCSGQLQTLRRAGWFRHFGRGWLRRRIAQAVTGGAITVRWIPKPHVIAGWRRCVPGGGLVESCEGPAADLGESRLRLLRRCYLSER